MRMNGSKRRGEASPPNEVNQSTDTAADTLLTLDNVQRFAAEQRAIAEDVLAKARDFEQQVANERRAGDELISRAEAAQLAEREAAAVVQTAREQLSVASAAEALARAEVDSGVRLLDERRDARIRAEAEVAQMQSGLELLSGRNGMNPDAIQRMLERRIADRLRES